MSKSTPAEDPNKPANAEPAQASKPPQEDDPVTAKNPDNPAF